VFDWETLGTAHAEPAGPADQEAVVAMVGCHEGEASARIAEHWWRRQPEAFAAFRTAAGELVGYIAGLALHRADPADLEADPAAAAARGFADRYGPARPGEELVHYRFWVGADSYQGPGSARNLLAATSCLEWLTNPRLAWCFLTFADPDAWHPVMTYLDQRRVPEADFEVGGRHYGVYAHDWRAEPPLAWLDRMAERELSDQRVEALEAELPAPLEAAEQLRANPRDERLYRALVAAFLQPAATQELAAERLGLPFSTYR